MPESKKWNLEMSELAKKTENPIRSIWESCKAIPNPSKNLITLQIGDPTIFGNFLAPPEAKAALKKSLEKDSFSYMSCAGLEPSREAVAEYINKNYKTVQNVENNQQISFEDVILTSGCSMALEMCFRVLANPGDNILFPKPCMGYSTWNGCGIDVRYFNLDPMKEWEVDLDHLESMINERTKAILINNPGNPCGNVYSKKHLLDILDVAERHRIPIIADEVYEFFTFPGVQFYPLAMLSNNVPILTCSGITKRFIMPAARMGWIIINDKNHSLDSIRKGLQNLAGRNFVPNSTLTRALPEILSNTPQKFFNDNSKVIMKHSISAYNILKTCVGLTPIMPKGSLYLMVKIDLDKFPSIKSCLEFSQILLSEQSVSVFPGFPCFNYPGFFRIVLTVPEELIIEACERIKIFCERHYEQVLVQHLKSG